jgi:hypothetical protein
MKNRNRLTRAGLSGLLLTGLVLACLNAQAGKPVPPPPPPASPPAIVYDRSDGICTMAADGTAQKCILPNSQKVSYRGPAFSPDGQRLALFRSTSAGVDLCVAKGDGSGLVALHRFASNAELPDGAVVWSPDGTRLLFTSAARPEDLLYVEVASPGPVHAVALDVVPNGSGLAISKDLDAVTPGYQGKAAFAAFYEDDADPYYHPLIAVLDLTFDAAGVPQLGLSATYISISDDPYYFAWSPAGDMLAYTGTPAELLPTRMHILNLNWEAGGLGSYLDSVVDPGMVNPGQKIAWSPDGRYLAYGRDGGYKDIFRASVNLDAAGVPSLSEIKNLTNTPKWTADVNPDWSPVWVPTP